MVSIDSDGVIIPIQRRRAVDEDVVVVLADRRQGVTQAALLHLHLEQGDLRGGEVAVGRQQLVAAVLGELHGLAEIAFADQHVVDRVFQAVLVDAAAHGRVALRVEVDQQHPALGRHQRGGQVDARRGLAHPAFLVGDREYLGHLLSP
jgi:hypothetical protein